MLHQPCFEKKKVIDKNISWQRILVLSFKITHFMKFGILRNSSFVLTSDDEKNVFSFSLSFI